MKILITGGAGFIGSWLVELLVNSGHELIVIDNLSPQIHGAIPQPSFPWLKGNKVQFKRCDVRNTVIIDDALTRVEAVVHLAAETGTGQSMYQISHYYEVNQQATAALFDAIGARHRHIRRVILASSRSVYGEGAYRLGDKIIVPAPRSTELMKNGDFEPRGPSGESLQLVATPEDVPLRPASFYAATKLANETLGRIFAEAYGTSVVALRFQNVYGERQSLINPYTGILSIFSNRMRLGLPINIFEDGYESRDFVHVSDVVNAINQCLVEPLVGFEAINIGSGRATTVQTVALLLRRLLGSDSPIRVTGDFRVGDIRHCYADLTNARKLIGFAPMVDLEVGMERFVRWVVSQEAFEDQSVQAQQQLGGLGLGRAHSS